MIGELKLSLPRLYLFVFFNAVYAFLSFWIGSTLLLAFPFAIFGILMYLFVAFFHYGISRLNVDDKKIRGKGIYK